MTKIGLIYSFNTIKTSKNAEKIKKAFGKEFDVELVNVEEIDEESFLSYKNLVLGVPTWFDGELPNYWDEFVPDLEEMDLKHKTFAVFGLGDQKGYPENFCDAIGILVEILENCGAEIIGKISTEGYSFESSRAQRDNTFVGLPLDQENQARLTTKRIESWVKQLKKEMK